MAPAGQPRQALSSGGTQRGQFSCRYYIIRPSHVRLHFFAHTTGLELGDLGDRGTEDVSSPFTRNHLLSKHETQPLVSRDLDPSFNDHTVRRRGPSRSPTPSLVPGSRQYQKSEYIAAAMEKLENSRLAYFANKLAVSSEPGLTNAQLMLHNFDLKPGQ